jgi:hypothetical protein
MSVLFAGLALVCATRLATVTVAASENPALAARARSAADAAALAAVAESAPFGGGRPLEEARRYAAINGGRLVTCRCEPGSTVVEVVVEVGAASARARAAFDPAALMPAPGATAEGLHPRLQEAVGRLLRAAGDRVRLVSGYRSGEHQRRLWKQALDRYGSADAARKWVAPPGASMHERGLAVDLGGDLELAARLVDRLRLPLHRPLPHEPWHFELTGSRG